MRVAKIIFLQILFVVSIVGCQESYRAGNLISLRLPIKTNLRTTIVKQYIDSLIQKKGYRVPYKWSHLNKLVDLDSINNKRLYFSIHPEEMYLISLQGQIILSDVYNTSIVSNDWISSRDSLSQNEEARIIDRFNYEILDVIESMAKRDGIADSLIYK